MNYFPIGRHLSLLYRAQQTYLTSETNECDIGGGQLAFVFTLFHNPGSSQEEVAQRLELDKTTVTRAVLKMEKNGIIRRERDPSDGRVLRLYLTDEGLIVHNQLKNVVHDWFNILVTGMTEKEITELERLMIKMSENARLFKMESHEEKDR